MKLFPFNDGRKSSAKWKKSDIEDKRVPGEESPCFPSNSRHCKRQMGTYCTSIKMLWEIIQDVHCTCHELIHPLHRNHNILETEKNCIKSFFCQLNGKIATQTWGNDLVKFLKGIFPYSPTIFLVICQPLIDCIWRPTWRLKRANHPFCRRLGRYQKLRPLNLSALGSARTLMTRFMT